ncbi:MAG TPA: FAD-binding protein [Caldilineaceae bacterium]|nr:FAD-binding protein [Caldilineaceae bacterium]
MSLHTQNWSGHAPFHAARFHQPTSLAELQTIVRNADKVKVIGARHCFNDIADTAGDMISLANLDKTVTLDRDRNTATVNAGITYGELCPQLHAAGYALHNMASLHHISVIGACMTGTHGSGDKSGNLATAVSGLEMVTADGELITLTRDQDGDTFNGAVVALGALGVVTKVTLDLLPTFDLHQVVYERLPMRHVIDSFDAIMSTGYSVSLFPTWQQDYVENVWVKQRVTDGKPFDFPPTFFDAERIDAARPIREGVDRYSTQMGVPGPWHERMPHFVFIDAERMGNELQSEYFVARKDAVAAIQAVAALGEHFAPVFGVTEIRTMTGDDLWLSMAYGQDTVGIHFNWLKDWAGVEPLLPRIEEALAPFNPRPHWGKLFTLTPAQIQAQYPRMADFRALAQELDPQGKFRNAYVDRYLFG